MFVAVAVALAVVVGVVLLGRALLQRHRTDGDRPTARHAQPFPAEVADASLSPDEAARPPRRGAHAMPVAPRGPDDDPDFIAELARTLRTRRSDPDSQ